MKRHLGITAAMTLTVTHGLATATGASPGYRYERLTPAELARAIEQCPVAFVPAGINEWHGEQSACGLDALKAETLAQMAADALGGICFPQVWLGPDASTPFDPEKYPRGTVTINRELYNRAAGELLERLRAMGFRVIVYLSGHYPGVIPEVAARFNEQGPMRVISLSENMAVQGMPSGDHAATWETSVLMVLRPGLVDLGRLPALPATTRPAGDVIPPAWPFMQRCEYYGVYGSDPRVWANEHFGRCGVQAVIDGLARQVRDALQEPAYAAEPRAIAWPADDRRQPEVRYCHLLPADWMKRFEAAPVVYMPLSTASDSEKVTQRAIRLAEQTGGMVFPPFSYSPAGKKEVVGVSAGSFEAIVSELVADLAEMDFRVIALVPSEELEPSARLALDRLKASDDQTEILVFGGDDPPVGKELLRAVRRKIPQEPNTRKLEGPWTLNNERTPAGLGEVVYGPGGTWVYEHGFELTPDESTCAALIDLGSVENYCELTINEAPALTDHWPPYRFVVTGKLRPGKNLLKVVVTHKPQPTLDSWFYRTAPPRLVGPATLSLWKP